MPETNYKIATIIALRADVHNTATQTGKSNSERAVELEQEIYADLIEEHGGRRFSTAGDSRLAQFENAIDAIHCAIEIQQTLLAENKRLPLEQRTLLRIGMHIGEVREKNGRISGDGCNIALGLAALAVPGGICLSGPVFEQIKQRGHVGVEFAGEKEIPNAPEPIAIYQVTEPGIETGHLSLWSELQRRNVVRVGVAYAVVGWLLIQIADVILPTFDAPRWMMQILISVVILGFPVAAVLAWIYELTPMGVKRSDDVLRQTSIRWLTGRRLDGAIISLLVVAVVFLVYENYVSKGIEKLNTANPVSVAVLAFENHGKDAADEYFADGLADELLGVLGRIRELKVASRTASFYFKDKDVDIDTIARTLMVGHVLSGSVRRDGERVRITAMLDDTENQGLLWTETYEEKFEALLDIQTDIAQSVASAIVPVLSPDSQFLVETSPTKSAEAYDVYLRGRNYLRKPAEEESLASAVKLFDRAVDLDRRFAEAYAGLCDAHLGAYEFARNPESFEKAEEACHRALTLDDSLWEVHVALGNLYLTNGQPDNAIVELESAIAAQPNAVESYLVLAKTYARQDKPELAESMFLRAEEVEAGYWGVHRDFGNFLNAQSRFAEAIERHIRVTELAPDSGIGHDNLGRTYLSIGEFDKAESAFNSSPLPSRWTYTNRGLVYYYRGEYSKAVEDHKRAIELAPQVHASWGYLADAYRFMPGEEDNGRKAYERAIELAEERLRISPADWRSVGQLGMYYAYVGRNDEAAAQIQRLLENSSSSNAYYYATRVRVQIGDMKGAFESLEQTIEAGWPRVLLASNPDIVALSGESGYAVLMAEPQG
ncbi:MAG: tetratricopeptide repeat protein [Woeseiaceae bacterium]|nr:tetratricopeptide repeat protein [Woeseiaceae bacterium]